MREGPVRRNGPAEDSARRGQHRHERYARGRSAEGEYPRRGGTGLRASPPSLPGSRIFGVRSLTAGRRLCRHGRRHDSGLPSNSRAADVHIQNIRRKIEPDPGNPATSRPYEAPVIVSSRFEVRWHNMSGLPRLICSLEGSGNVGLTPATIVVLGVP